MRVSWFFMVALIAFLVAVLPLRGQPKTGESSPTTPNSLGGKTLDQWCKEILDRDPSIRENAIRTVMLFGRDAQKPAGPALITEMRDQDISCRVNAVIAIGVIGLDSKDLNNGITGLRGALKDVQAIVRYQAALALGRLGPDSRSAIPDLLYTLRDRQSWELRRAAAFALGRISGDTEKGPDTRAVGDLITHVSMSNEASSKVRFECVMALGILGPPRDSTLALAMTKSLEGCTQDRDKTVQVWAHVLLREITKGSSAADGHLTAIAKLLEAPELAARTHAAEAIGTIGAEAKACVPGLVKLLRDKEPLASMKAIFALAALGDAAKQAIPNLKELTKHDDEDIKEAAKYAIETIEKPPKKPK